MSRLATEERLCIGIIRSFHFVILIFLSVAVLFANESPQAEIKLIDFGLSKMFGHEELTDGVGTIYTMAPEVLKGKYTKQADLWSVGVIAYVS